ncbi:MAG: response regulator [Verrucomicrobia bacterium]|nr:response regulator [Verrucomicrobiota bacterium]
MKINFQTKVLVPVVGFLVLLPAVTVWLVNRHLTRQAEEQTRETLVTAEAVFRSSLELRARNLLARYRSLVNEPRFKAVARLADRATMQARIEEMMEETGREADVILFLTAQDELLAGTSRDPVLSAAEFQTAAARTTRAALRGESAFGHAAAGVKVFHAVSAPVTVGDQLIGALTVGVRIAGPALRDIRAVAHAEIVLLSAGAVSASTLAAPGLHRDLVAMHARLMRARRPRPRPMESLTAPGDHFLALAGELADGSAPGPRAGFLLLSSDAPMRLELAETRATLAEFSALGTLISAAIIWLLLRKITAPLRQLRDSAEAVGRGDFSQRVRADSGDECGELARSFNQMTANLQSSRAELEKTVGTLRATKEQLVQSEKLSAVGQFVAGVAHELNNPLTAVVGFSELLRLKSPDPEQRTQLDYITKSAMRCHKIVQNLLSFSRQHAPERKLVKVNELVEAVLELLAYEMRTGNIQVTPQLAPDLPAILGDPHQLQQVFLNLVNNARQAIEGHRPAGAIRVRTLAAGANVCVEFEDDGPGIAPEHLPRIFDPFFTTKPVGQGTGLGLSLCYGIIQEHGGAIYARSEPGKWTIFTIELPVPKADEARAAEHGQITAAPRPRPGAGAGRKVLVVDDEPEILRLVAAILEADGYTVDAISDGEAALGKIAKVRYDIIVSDWKMPGCNGLEILERLQQTDPESAARLMFMTGDVINETFTRTLREQRRTCLNKPFTLQEFRAAVAGLLGASGVR